jgi:hypothetical protein
MNSMLKEYINHVLAEITEINFACFACSICEASKASKAQEYIYREKFNTLLNKLRKYEGQYAITDMYYQPYSHLYPDDEDVDSRSVAEVARTQLVFQQLPDSALRTPLFYETKEGIMMGGVFEEFNAYSIISQTSVLSADSIALSTLNRTYDLYLPDKKKEKYKPLDFVLIQLHQYLTSPAQGAQGVLHKEVYSVGAVLPFVLLERAISVCSTLAQLYVLCERLEKDLFDENNE